MQQFGRSFILRLRQGVSGVFESSSREQSVLLLRSNLKHAKKRARFSGMGAPVITLIVLGGLVALFALWGIGGYNSLVTKDTRVDQAASNIESQMKRRADLIPNLVATVKGYATHEKEVYDNIANARSRLLNADIKNNPKEAAAANSAFQSSLGRLLAVAENYPQLKADQNFVRLQDELTGTENRMNFARVEFNNAVADYNVTVRRFPGNIIAGITGFNTKELFKAAEAEKAVPKVAF